MPFSLHTHPISWNLYKTHPTTKQSIPGYQNLIFRKVQVFSSLRTSLDCVSSDGGLQPIRLPFVVRSSTKVTRFFWNGSCLDLVTVGGAGSADEDNDDGLFWVFGCIVRDFFIPRQVSDNYMDYVKWKLLHRVFSSALQVLATQAMFTAIGVGYSSSLPSAAALNWVLKDGLGRLSRCIYTASLASAFDTNLKRVRFATSVLFVGSIGLELLTPAFPKLFLLLATIANIAKQISLACYLATRAMFTAIGVGYSSSLPSAAALNWVLKDGLGRLSRCIYTASLASAFDTNLKRVRFATSVLFVGSIGLELLTPAFPKLFLLLATIANIAKQISLACYLATRSAVHQSFAKADNLGEISAKAQIQTVCFDILGLMLAALVNMWIGNHQRPQAGVHFFVYPFFASMDLFGIYQGLKHVHLQTLTKDRLEIILNTWIEFGYVPSPAEVSEKEVINFTRVKGKSLWPIRIGCINPKDQIPKWSMETIQSITDEDYYFVCVEIFKGLKRTPQHRILLSVREGAEAAHIIMGLLQACYIRRTLLANRSKSEIIIGDNNASNTTLEDWFVIVEDGKRSAERDLTNLIEQMVGMGWVVKNILLSKQEQARYSFV